MGELLKLWVSLGVRGDKDVSKTFKRLEAEGEALEKQLSDVGDGMSDSAKKTETAAGRMSKAIRGVGREAKDLDGQNITLSTKLEGAGRVTQGLEAIKNRQKDLDRSKITLSTSLKGAKESIGELTRLEGVSTRIDGDKVTLTAEVDGTREGRAALQSLQQAASRIDGDDIRMKAEVVGAPQAVGELAELNREADRIDGREVNLKVDRNSTGALNALGDALTRVATRMRALQTVSVAAVIPGLVAAIGAIPAIVTPAVAALGALAAGMGAGLAGASAVGVGALGTFAGALGLIATPVTMLIGKLTEAHKSIDKIASAEKTAGTTATAYGKAQQGVEKAVANRGQVEEQVAQNIGDAWQDYQRKREETARVEQQIARDSADAWQDYERQQEETLQTAIDVQQANEDAARDLHDARVDLAGATGAVVREQREYNEALEDEPRNQAYAALEREEAIDRESDALREYNEAVAEHGKNSEEATDAYRRWQRASLDLEVQEEKTKETQLNGSEELQGAFGELVSAQTERLTAAEQVRRAEEKADQVAAEGSRRMAEARQAEADQLEAFRRTQAEGAEQLRQARQAEADQFEAYRRAQADGQRQIAAAQRQVEEAQLAAAEAADKLAEAEKGVLDEIIPLTAAQKRLYDEFMRFKEFGAGIFTPAMDEAARLGVEILDLGRLALPSVGRASFETMQAVTQAFRTIRAELMKPVEQAGFAKFLATIPRFTEVAATAVGRLGIAFFNVFVRTLPYVMDFAHWLGEMGARALAFTRSAEGIRKVDEWLAYSVMRAKELFSAIGNLTLGFFGLFAAFEQAGLIDQVWGGFVRLTEQFREATKAGTESRQAIVQWATDIQPILTALGSFVGELARQWMRVTNAVIRMRDETGKLVLPQFIKDLQDALVIIGDLLIEAFRNFGPHLGPIIKGLAEFLKYAIALNPVLQTMTQGFAWLLTKFRELSPEMKTAIAAAASLRIAYAIAVPVIAAMFAPLTRMAGALGLVATRMGLVSGAAGAKGGAGLLGRIGRLGALLVVGGPVLVGLGLLAGGLYTAYQKNEEFRDSVNTIGTRVSTVFGNLGTRMETEWGPKITDALNAIADAVIDIFDLEEKDKAKIESQGRKTGGAFIAGTREEIRKEAANQSEGTPAYELGFKMGKAIEDGFRNSKGGAAGGGGGKSVFRQRAEEILADLRVPGFTKAGSDQGSQFIQGLRKSVSPETINRAFTYITSGGLGGYLIKRWKETSPEAGFRQNGRSLATRLIEGMRARWSDGSANAGFRKDGESLASRFWAGIKTRWTQGQNETQASDVTWRQKLGSKWNSFTTWAGQKWGTFWGGVKRHFSEGQNTTQTGDVSWRQKLGGKWNSFTAWGAEKWNSFWADVKRFFKGGQDTTQQGDVSWREKLGSKWNSFTSWAGEKWKTFWGGVKERFKDGQDRTVEGDRTWREKLGSKWNSFTAWSLEKWRTWKEDLKTAFRNLRDDTKPIMDQWGENIWRPVESAWNSLKGIFNSILEGMADVADVVGLDGVGEKLRGVKFSTEQTSQGDAPAMMARGGVIKQRNTGGIADRPHAVYGEAGPEAYIRLDKRTPESQEAFRAAAQSPNARYFRSRTAEPPPYVKQHPEHFAAGGQWTPQVGGVADEMYEKFGLPSSTYAGHGRLGRSDLSIDFVMPSGWGVDATGSSKSLGDRAAQYMVDNWERFSTEYLIWYRQMKESLGSPWFTYRGGGGYGAPVTPSDWHTDHIHYSSTAAWGGEEGLTGTGGQGGILASLWETVGNAIWNRLVQKPWDNFKEGHLEGKGVPTQLLGGVGDTLLNAIKDKFISESGSSGGALPGGASPSGLTLAEAVAKGGWPEHLRKTAVGVAWEESSANARAQNPSGARGLFQIMPGTASDVGADYEKLYDPIYNSAAGRKVYDLQGWGAWVAHPPSYDSMSRGNTPITGYARGGIDRPHRRGDGGWRLERRTESAFRTVAETLARFTGGTMGQKLPIGDKGGVGWGQIRAITDEAGPEAIIPLSQKTPEGESALAAAMRRYGIKAMQYGGTLGWGLVKRFEDGSEGIGINPQTKYASLVEQAISAWHGLGVLTMKRGSFYGDSVPVYDDYNLGSSTLGRSYSDGKIALNPTLLDRYPASRILSTISHELGHIVDLAHYSGGGLMHTPSYEGRPSLPGSTERTNLARIYGPPERGVEEHDPPSSGGTTGTTGGTGATQTNRSSNKITSSGGGSSYIVTHNGKVVASSGSAQGSAGRVAGSGVINRGAISRPMSGMTHVNVQATDPELRKQMEKMENTLNTTLKRQEQKMIQARELAREIIQGTKHTIGSGAADRELDHIISEALS